MKGEGTSSDSCHVGGEEGVYREVVLGGFLGRRRQVAGHPPGGQQPSAVPLNTDTLVLWVPGGSPAG